MADGHSYLDYSGADIYPSHLTSQDSDPSLSLFRYSPGQPSAKTSLPERVLGADYGNMFSQGHGSGHNSRLNGSNAGRGMPMIYNFQQHGAQHQQGHGQHHQGIQPDHGGHNGNGSVMGHHQTYSSGMLSSASPFSQTPLQNGHSTTARTGPGPLNEHWAEQLRLYKESQQAHTSMVENQAPNYYARLKASEQKFISVNPSAFSKTTADGEAEERNRPWVVESSNKTQEWHQLDMSGQGLRNLAPPLFAYKFLQELYIASNKLMRLPPAIGELRQLQILEASNNLLTELPAELGMCTYLKQLLLFDNRIQKLPNELGSLHLLEMLGIEGNPLSADMKQEIMDRGTKSLITLLREQSPVPFPPAPRKLITVQEDVSPSLETLKVFSWNVLCDKYATAQTYGYTPSGALNWEYRKDCILEEIESRDADFLCLQEVSTDAFKDDFMPVLAAKDYKGVHFPKSRARTMTEKDAMAVDGCAVLYKGSKYILLDKQLIEFATIAINRPDMKGKADVFNRIMPKDNIGIICLFESRATGARIVIANLHLTWDSLLADVKLIQTGILMENVAKMADKYTRWPPLKDKKHIIFPTAALDDDGQEIPTPPPAEPGPSQEYRSSGDIPLLVCGDFNSTTDSSVYNFLSAGRVLPDLPELSEHDYGNFSKDGIEHPFSLRDAYAPLQGTADELPFTNYTPGFADVIDYIWYSTNTLEVVSLLGPPDPEHLKTVPAFPNYHFPADHIQIMGEFVIKPRKDKKVLPEPDFGSGSGNR